MLGSLRTPRFWCSQAIPAFRRVNTTFRGSTTVQPACWTIERAMHTCFKPPHSGVIGVTSEQGVWLVGAMTVTCLVQ